jgi:hypothetical protein
VVCPSRLCMTLEPASVHMCRVSAAECAARSAQARAVLLLVAAVCGPRGRQRSSVVSDVRVWHGGVSSVEGLRCLRLQHSDAATQLSVLDLGYLRLGWSPDHIEDCSRQTDSQTASSSSQPRGRERAVRGGNPSVTTNTTQARTVRAAVAVAAVAVCCGWAAALWRQRRLLCHYWSHRILSRLSLAAAAVH